MTGRDSGRTFGRAGGRVLFAAAALAAGAISVSVVDDVFAAPTPLPLARDEEFVVRLRGAVSLGNVIGGALRVKAQPGSGLIDPYGRFFAGRALIDPATKRAVVVRPEALREFFQLVRGLDRDEADASAERVLARVTRTGKLGALNAIDAGLRELSGPNAGTRLDDPNVSHAYPASRATPPVDGGFGLRELVAGDDALWRAYVVHGDIDAFKQLETNPGTERFVHPRLPFDEGEDPESVLRLREHRRVLMRRVRNTLTFIPDIPTHPNLIDAGFVAGAQYDVKAVGGVRALVRDILPAKGGVLRFVKGLARIQIALDTGDGGELTGAAPGAAAPADPPRVVNITPPAGETFIDPTTDWENPDNQFLVPIPQRRPFVVRLRFSRPLDPRTVDAAHFTFTKVALVDALGNSTPVHVPVAVDVFLAQTRLGEVVVQIQPYTNIDPSSRYEVRVAGTVRGLGGTPMGADFVSQ